MKRSLISVCALGLVSVVPALLVACGGSDSNQPQPIAPTASAPQPGYPGYPTGPTGPTGAYPPANTGPQPTAQPTGPAPGPFPTAAPAAGGGTAQPLDPNMAAAATAPLALFANSEAPGMAKDGAAVAGTFQEGQTLEAAFTFQPGKCYTLVAGSAGPQQIEVEMQYTTPIPGLNPSIGKSSQAGPQASIGGKASCLKPLSPIAAPAKYILRVKKGAGIAVAQLYSK